MSRSNLNNDWRKVASSVYRKPVDSKIFGSVEIDVSELEAYISEKRKKGVKITLTHFFTLAVSRAIGLEVPELNCYIRRGNIIHREQVDAVVSVLVSDTQMSSVRVHNADRISYKELAEILNEGVQESRKGNENSTMRAKGFFARMPWPFRGWLFRLLKFVTVGMGISVPSIGLTADNFGSFVISNIGSIGLDKGYPALFPISNVAMVFIMGGVFKKPVVVNDEIVIRRMISLSCALDHRVVDAVHGGKLFKYLKQAARNPERFENKA